MKKLVFLALTLVYRLFMGHTKEDVTLAYTHLREETIRSGMDVVMDVLNKRLPKGCQTTKTKKLKTPKPQ